MEHHSVEPLLAAGYEGFFGLLTTLSGLLLIYRLYGMTSAGQGGYFDMKDGWDQIVEHPRVWQSSIVIAISIALFNLCVSLSPLDCFPTREVLLTFAHSVRSAAGSP